MPPPLAVIWRTWPQILSPFTIWAVLNQLQGGFSFRLIPPSSPVACQSQTQSQTARQFSVPLLILHARTDLCGSFLGLFIIGTFLSLIMLCSFLCVPFILLCSHYCRHDALLCSHCGCYNALLRSHYCHRTYFVFNLLPPCIFYMVSV